MGQRGRPRKLHRKKVNTSDWCEDISADDSHDEAASIPTTTANPLRPMNMNAFAVQQQQQPRQPNRVQNVQKSSLGNGLGGSGWGMGLPGTAGGFGAALNATPALGAARPGQLSGFAQVMGGGGQQGPIDMSDFPTLSGGPRAQPSNNAAASWSSNAIRQPLTQQQQAIQQQPSQQQRAPSAAPSQHSLEQFDGQRSQQPSVDRLHGGDDFPPLGGQLNGDALLPSDGFGSGITSPDSTNPRTNGQQIQLPIRDASNAIQQRQHAPMRSTQASQSFNITNGQQQPPAKTMKKYGDMTEQEQWGLSGLMAAFESRRQVESGGRGDETLPPALRNAVLMGQDLSQLGLDLESPDLIYPTFTPFPNLNGSGSQFDFHDRHMVPDFTLPSAYTVTNVPPLSSRMSAFSDETLFSIFYQYPRDVNQELAAMELTARDWRWHRVLRQWLQKDARESNSGSSLPIVDLANGAPVGAPPLRVGDRTEKGVYVFFDATNWRRERREFVLDYDQLDHRHGNAMPASGAALGGSLSVGVPGGPVGGSSQIPGA